MRVQRAAVVLRPERSTIPVKQWLSLLTASALAPLLYYSVSSFYGAVAFALALAYAVVGVVRLLWQQETPNAFLYPAIVGSALAAMTSVWMRLRGEPTMLALEAAASAALPTLLLWFDSRHGVLARSLRRNIQYQFPSHAKVVSSGHVQEVASCNVRVGDEVVASAGDVFPVDAVVVAGEADVKAHPHAAQAEAKAIGDGVIAGAAVVRGELRATASATLEDRALALPATLPQKLGESTMMWGHVRRLLNWQLPSICALAVVAALVNSASISQSLSAAVAVLLASPALALLRCLDWPLTVATAVATARGVIVSTSSVFEECGRVRVAAVGTRGAVCEEQAQVHAVEKLGTMSFEEVVGIAMSVEQHLLPHPISNAITTYANQHGVAPVQVHSIRHVSGLGVSATTDVGRKLVLGSRRLLLREGIALARAERVVSQAEKEGRTAVFLGVDGQLEAAFLLQYAFVPGLVAAVQRLMDLKLDVVMLSGDHFETATAIAKRFDIGRVKAELSGEERGEEVRKLRETGDTVAFIGLSKFDQEALQHADVAVALGDAGHWAGRGGLATTSARNKDAVDGLYICRVATRTIFESLTVVGGFSTLLILGAVFGVISPGVAAALSLVTFLYAAPSSKRLLARLDHTLDHGISLDAEAPSAGQT